MTVKEVIVLASASAETRAVWGSYLCERYSIHEAAEHKLLQQLVAGFKPCIVIMDLTLPGLGGIVGLPLIRRASPNSRILALTDKPTCAEGVGALKAGAKGYYTLRISAALVGKAVSALLNDELWIERKLVAALVANLVSLDRAEEKLRDGRSDRRFDCLTVRQREVASAIATGASNKEIAIQLNVTERTVKAHLTEMFRNLGVLDRVHLAVLLNRVAGTGMQAIASLDKPDVAGNAAAQAHVRTS